MIKNRNDILKGMITNYKNDPRSNDRKNMSKSVIPFLNNLIDMGHQKITDFVEVFEQVGFKRSDIVEFILKFQDHLLSKKIIKESIKNRTIQRGSNYDRNIILNRLIFQDEKEFISFLKNYPNLNEKESTNTITNLMNAKIDEGKKNVNIKILHFFNDENLINTNEEEDLEDFDKNDFSTEII